MKIFVGFFSLIFLLGVLVTPHYSFADSGDGSSASATIKLEDPFNCPPAVAGGTSSPCLIQIFQGIIGRFTQVVFPILAGMVFYGGFQMMAARGSTEKYGAGKKTITYAVIGFAVILVSQGIGFILIDLLTRRA